MKPLWKENEAIEEFADPVLFYRNTIPSVKSPPIKLLWLIVLSMVAVQESNCQYCPTHNGLYPNVVNCKCFFKCVDGVPIQKWCPPGLKFDVMSMTCSFPAKTVCAGSLIHTLPSVLASLQKQGGSPNLIHQPSQQPSNNGNYHITLALAKPNNNGGNGGDMQIPGGNMMQMMQMMMMMMQNQGMNGNMNQQNNKYQNMMMNNNNIMNQNMDQQNMMDQNNMNQNMMNQNNMNQNMKYQKMKQNNMNQNMMNMNQNMMNQNMNQNMNMDMMNQNMNQNMNMDMMNQNMNQNMNMDQSGGGQQPQCMGSCHKHKKQITIVYDINLNKFPIRFKLFG